MTRHCGDCQLCCKLLPVNDLEKKANQKCQYQKHHVGCTVYETGKMPPCCKIWNCRWLVEEVPRDIGRPDRVHYVIDVMPDFVTMVNDDKAWNMQVVQIWCDPRYPDAHRDPALRAWLLELSEEGILGMVRYNERDALTLVPPTMTCDGKWWERMPKGMQEKGRTHTFTEIVQALGGSVKIVTE